MRQHREYVSSHTVRDQGWLYVDGTLATTVLYSLRIRQKNCSPDSPQASAPLKISGSLLLFGEYPHCLLAEHELMLQLRDGRGLRLTVTHQAPGACVCTVVGDGAFIPSRTVREQLLQRPPTRP